MDSESKINMKFLTISSGATQRRLMMKNSFLTSEFGLLCRTSFSGFPSGNLSDFIKHPPEYVIRCNVNDLNDSPLTDAPSETTLSLSIGDGRDF